MAQKDLQQVSGIKIRNIPYIALILLTESRRGWRAPSFDKRESRIETQFRDGQSESPAGQRKYAMTEVLGLRDAFAIA